MHKHPFCNHHGDDAVCAKNHILIKFCCLDRETACMYVRLLISNSWPKIHLHTSSCFLLVIAVDVFVPITSNCIIDEPLSHSLAQQIVQFNNIIIFIISHYFVKHHSIHFSFFFFFCLSLLRFHLMFFSSTSDSIPLI